MPGFLLFHIETGSPYIVLAGLKLAVQTRLAMNSQGSACLCLLGNGIRGVSFMALMPGFVCGCWASESRS